MKVQVDYIGSWPSGRWQQTVNLPSENYNKGSNPLLPAMEEIKKCKKHGLTLHVLDNSNRWRCRKCRVEAVLKRRDKLKELAVKYKGGKCCICGYNKYKGALEFHHLDPSKKDFGISAKGYTRSWELIKKELDKCILVCSNCHKEIHAGFTKI